MYKYIDKKDVDSFRQGRLLFSNLSHFRIAYEDGVRGDETEGVHVDHPDNDVSVTVLNTGNTFVGDFRMLNAVDHDNVYIHSTSLVLQQSLFVEFGTGCCIKIDDQQKFFQLTKRAMEHRFGHNCFVRRAVEYYNTNSSSPLDIKNPRLIPFLKSSKFKNQQEYRMCFATHEGFTIRQSLVTSNYSHSEEIQKLTPRQLFVEIGSIHDITTTLTKNEVCV